MGHTTRKLQAALAAADNDPEFKAAFPRFRLMKLETLYHSLELRGYWWDSQRIAWVPRQEITIRGGRAVAERVSITRPMNGVFILRILAERDEIDQIHSELVELSAALGWSIEASGPSNVGGEEDGFFVSIKYVVKRG